MSYSRTVKRGRSLCLEGCELNSGAASVYQIPVLRSFEMHFAVIKSRFGIRRKASQTSCFKGWQVRTDLLILTINTIHYCCGFLFIICIRQYFFFGYFLNQGFDDKQARKKQQGALK
jgi:hypothetical protein